MDKWLYHFTLLSCHCVVSLYGVTVSRHRVIMSLYGLCHCIRAGHYEYLPFFVPFKMIMGIAPLDPDEWIQIDPFYKEEMKMKRWVLENRRDVALVSLPEAEDCNREMLELLIDHLPKRFPKM